MSVTGLLQPIGNGLPDLALVGVLSHPVKINQPLQQLGCDGHQGHRHTALVPVAPAVLVRIFAAALASVSCSCRRDMVQFPQRPLHGVLNVDVTNLSCSATHSRNAERRSTGKVLAAVIRICSWWSVNEIMVACQAHQLFITTKVHGPSSVQSSPAHDELSVPAATLQPSRVRRL